MRMMRYYFRATRKWVRKRVDDPLLALWKIMFALVAIVDMSTCWPMLVEAWNSQQMGEEEQQQQQQQQPTCIDDKPSHDWLLRRGRSNHSHDNTSCSFSAPVVDSHYYWFASGDGKWKIQATSMSGPLFCLLCLVEAFVRAREARILAIENQALDNFENSVQRVYSSTRMSFRRFGVAPDTTLDAILARSTLRTWIPTITVICFWLSLVPVMTKNPRNIISLENYSCGNSDDASWTTYWIKNTLYRYALWSTMVEEYVASTLWKWALPYKVYQQPVRFYSRIRQLLRWIRYARFAFPLMRMMLKLFDQLCALTKTWRQSIVAQAEKAKRLARRSMIFDDIRKIESLAKVQTALAALPSQLFHISSEAMVEGLQRQQEQGRKLQRQLQQLKLDVVDHSMENTSELYDRVVRLTQELYSTVNTTLLSSSHHLISPHSRFSVMWRVMVTNCLLLEIFRLTVSWYLSDTFKISLTQVISRLLIECEDVEMTQRFAFITDRVRDIRKGLAAAIPLLPTPLPDDLMMCVPSSPSAALFLQMGGMLEAFVDVVSFVDIFIWFFTGDLDVKGLIIPKPFFTRCILPGTLVQVLDHPTLPEALPTLISQAMNAASAAGWSRSIRWVLAIVPAVLMLVVRPFISYFFQHMDTSQDFIMRYAESCGMLVPARSSTLISSSTSGSMGDEYHHVSSSTPSTSGVFSDTHPSQVGLSFDSPHPPAPGRSITSMSTEVSSSTKSFIPPPPQPPSLNPTRTSTPMIQSILRPSRSIHFDPALFKNNEAEHEDDDDSYQFSYSNRSVNLDD